MGCTTGFRGLGLEASIRLLGCAASGSSGV